MRRAKVSAFLLFCLALAPAGYGALTGIGSVPVSFTVANSCLTEQIAFSGSAHFVDTVTRSSSGVLTVGFTFEFSGIHGVGLTSGRHYQFSSVEIDHLTVTGRGGASTSFIETAKVSGSNGQFTLHFVGHLTINNNGTVTVAFNDFRAAC